MLTLMPQNADWARISVAVAGALVLAYMAASVAGRVARAALGALIQQEHREGRYGEDRRRASPSGAASPRGLPGLWQRPRL